jgi:hypothetical protein
MHRHGWIEIASADDDMNAAAVLRSISFNDLPASTGAGRVRRSSGLLGYASAA